MENIESTSTNVQSNDGIDNSTIEPTPEEFQSTPVNVESESNEGEPESPAIDNTKVYECKICPANFEEIALVKWHWYDIHNMKKLQICKVCEIPFPTIELLREHKYAKHDVFCPLCGRGYNNENQLDNHVFGYHKTALKYPCKICGMVLDRKKDLIQHFKEHDSVMSATDGERLIFRCNVCAKIHLEAEELKVHERLHNPKWNTPRPTPEQHIRKLQSPRSKGKRRS